MRLLKAMQSSFDTLSNSTDWKQRENLECAVRILPKATRSYVINATGDCCKGDNILFIKRIWSRKAINRFGKLANVVTGYEWVEGEIINDSYGQDKQQHTFTILLTQGEKLLIKGRNLYAVGVWRKQWVDENERKIALSEKYARGKSARQAKYDRLEHYY